MNKNILTFAVLLILTGFVVFVNMYYGEKIENQTVSQEVYDFESITGRISVLSFSSPYCNACKEQKKEVEIVRSELSKEAAFQSIDVTKDSQTSSYYDVGIVPTILITYNGIEVERFTGVHKAGELGTEIKKQIEKHRYCQDGTLC